MWTAIHLVGSELKGWHIVNREEVMEVWVSERNHTLTSWQDRMNPELRGEVWLCSSYAVSDNEIRFIKGCCWTLFE